METSPTPEKRPDFLKMYEIPGQEKISEHSFERYLRDKENLPKEEIAREAAVFLSFQKHSRKSSQNREIAREKTKRLHVEEFPSYVENGLKSDDPETQKIAIEAIGGARSEIRSELLRKAFEIQNEETELACVKAISNIPEEERIGFIRIGLSKESFAIKKASVKMIQYAPQELRAKLIKQGLSGEDVDLRKEYAKAIHSAPTEKERKELLNLAKKNLGNALVEPPLYNNTQISSGHFSREEFAKTGSGTTLVGGELKDKAIFRHIAPEAFSSWKEAYENHEVWKSAGFNYVPIEPILSFHQNKNGLIDVASGILDISFKSWEKMSGDFSQELDKEKKKIITILNESGIVHGHPHDGNFCLRFFRKENGDVDFSKKPRIYLIDFDRAVSP